jgi:predicted phosphodiesterase
VATVTSNHGEARNAQKVNPYGSDNDWGLMIFRIIQGKCQDRGWDVEFHFPDKGEDTVVIVTEDGSKFALSHGHHSGTPARVKEWVRNQIVGRRPGWDADMWMLGHYHHVYQDTVGANVTIFGTPSLDPGSSWFTRRTGESSKPGITVMSIREGSWFDYSVVS